MINLYIANLGKYNEGFLVGKWIELPCSEDELNQLYVEIGVGYYDKENDGSYVSGLWVDDCCYEEIAIHDFETDVDGLEIGEYSSISDLNEVAEKLDNLKSYELDLVKAIVELGNDDIYEALEHHEDYSLMSDVNDTEDLGRYYVEEMEFSQIPEHLKYYFDYAAYGESIDINNCNSGFTSFGYLLKY